MKKMIPVSCLLAAIAGILGSGFLFKPLVYSPHDWVRVLAWIPLGGAFVLITAAALRVIPRQERTVRRLAKIYSLAALGTAILYGLARYFAMEWSHFFAPERAWEISEIQLTSALVGVLFAIAGAVAVFIIRRKAKSQDSRG